MRRFPGRARNAVVARTRRASQSVDGMRAPPRKAPLAWRTCFVAARTSSHVTSQSLSASLMSRTRSRIAAATRPAGSRLLRPRTSARPRTYVFPATKVYTAVWLGPGSSRLARAARRRRRMSLGEDPCFCRRSMRMTSSSDRWRGGMAAAQAQRRQESRDDEDTCSRSVATSRRPRETGRVDACRARSR